MIIRLAQLDGKLPNLALMKLAHWHRSRGDDVHLVRGHRAARRDLFESASYDRVYGSAIFTTSAQRVQELLAVFPGAIIGGTWDPRETVTVEQIIGEVEYDYCDYSIYPDFSASIGFTQRGYRLKCGFCVVPHKEGKPRAVSAITEIWRGEPWPKHLHLLDNDFFGQDREQWQARIAEIRSGGFKVCLNQGINVRMIDEEAAEALASIPYYDVQFRRRRLYTAWDNIGDVDVFFRGIDLLERAGVPPSHIMIYMLVGYDRRETWERVFFRFNRLVERGIRPYPMVYGDRDRRLPLGGYSGRIADRSLGQFQRWAIRASKLGIPFAEYSPSARRPGWNGHEPTGDVPLDSYFADGSVQPLLV